MFLKIIIVFKEIIVFGILQLQSALFLRILHKFKFFDLRLRISV